MKINEGKMKTNVILLNFKIIINYSTFGKNIKIRDQQDGVPAQNGKYYTPNLRRDQTHVYSGAKI